MKKDIVVFLLLALLGLFCVALPGCMTKEKAMKKWGITIRDSVAVRDSIIPRIIPVKVPVDSICWRDSVPCKDFAKEFRDNDFTISIKSKGGVMTGKALHDPPPVNVEVSDTLRIPERFHTTNVPPNHDCPYWVIDPACRVISLLAFILFAIWLILRARK